MKTFYDIFLQYYSEKQLFVSRAKSYENLYYNHIHNYVGHLSPCTIAKSDILKIQVDKKNNGLSHKTINNITDYCSTIFNYGINEGLISCPNPIKRLRKLKIDNRRERWLSTDDIAFLIKEIGEDIDLKRFVILSLHTGARMSTIMNIKRKDISYKNSTVTLKDNKNNSTYLGYLDSVTMELLGDIKRYSPNKSVINYHESTIRKKMKTTLDKLFNKGLKKDDRKNRVVIHTFRHTFFSHLVSNGVPIYTVKTLGNHHSIESTMRYSKLSPHSGAKEVRRLYLN